MNTGAKKEFISTEIEKAPSSFFPEKGPDIASVTPGMPKLSTIRGAHDEKTFMAMAIPTPRIPHTMARGARPNPG